ncbi:bZIP transcription factor-like protein [Polyplosphaeria fusca]|uniref:BZIP transcription factor-like protein n=1 Tax=Polyplosphaeria fusca TaxID=682080 RepID=A0A9P4R173_9PLEO|nr:bZIP transcription factor-like protein [Polyplosphaeria fusca]
MSGYQGRTGPNVSQYLANLNTAPSEFLPDPFNNDDPDLALFTNDFVDGDFGDLGMNQPIDFDSIAAEPSVQTQARKSSVSRTPAQPKMDDFAINGGDFTFADYDFQTPLLGQPMSNLAQSQPNNFALQAYTSPVSASVSPVAPHFDLSSKKRKADHVDTNSQQALDEQARLAAEEDKRRRNTAASARFRVKKKQREAALEKNAKAMSEKLTYLESRVQQLETENVWLKGLITEKNGGRSSSSEITAMLKKHKEENAVERSTGSNTDGVGTQGNDGKA